MATGRPGTGAQLVKHQRAMVNGILRCAMSDDRREDLLPCPFCGWGIAYIEKPDEGQHFQVSVVCDNCLASASPNDDEAGAIASWQARAKLDRNHEQFNVE